MARKSSKKTPEEIAADNLAREVEEHRTRLYISEPTIQFEVGERVSWGAHPNAIIEEKYDGGKFYKVRAFGEHPVYGKMTPYKQTSILMWTDMQKFRTPEENSSIPCFAEDDNMHLNYSQRSLSGLILSYYKAGVDLSPDYQRGNVWNLDDKKKLIDSIFRNIDIGKFVVVRKPYKENDTAYEMLDGKQRLTTIIEFIENRFQYKGLFYKDLCWKDQMHIDGYAISYAELGERTTQQQKYAYFLRLNQGGRAVDPAHIAHVQELFQKSRKGDK